MRNRLNRVGQLLRPEGLRLAQSALRFGQRAHLTSDRFTQARHAGKVESWGLDLLPPVRLAEELVVDVGANVGGFTAAVLTLEPHARVLAIEPAPPVHQKIAARFANDPRVRIENRAVTDTTGTVRFHLTSRSEFGSILTPRDVSEYGSAATVTGQIHVAGARLDDIVNESVSVLKIDVQGNEAAVLRGAERVLSETRSVLIEVLFQSHYEGDSTFGELDRIMGSFGLVLWDMGRVRRQGGAALWADACYVPRSAVPALRNAQASGRGMTA